MVEVCGEEAGLLVVRRWWVAFFVFGVAWWSVFVGVSQVRAATPRTLFTVPEIETMMAGGGRIAWIHDTRPGLCYTAWVRGDTSGVARRLNSCVYSDSTNSMVGVGSTRVFWEEAFEAHNETDWRVLTAASPGSTRTIESLVLACGSNGCSCGNAGFQLGRGAAANGEYVYSTLSIDGDPTDCQSGGGMIVTGGNMRRSTASGHVRLANASGASLVAAANGRFAELPQVPQGPAQPDIEVRNITTGALVCTITSGGTVTELAMSREGVVAQIESNGATALRLYNSTTGALIRSRFVRSTARLINASGARALYLIGEHDIRIFNLTTGRTHAIFTTRHTLRDIRLDGRLIAWVYHKGTVRGITLPRIPAPKP